MTATFWRTGETADCAHCGEPVVFVYLPAGTGWTHRHDGPPSSDGDHVFCHVNQAEPMGETE